MIYLDLFLGFLQVGLFSIGGGYAAIPLIQSQAVQINGWLTMTEFTNLITIAEMTPGPIAINSATFVGIRVAGPLGAIIATVGCILPSCIIVTLLFYIYRRYNKMSAMQHVLSSLRPAVVALILSAGLSILGNVAFLHEANSEGRINFIGTALFAAAFIALRKFKLNPILIMLLCGVCMLMLHFFQTAII